MGKFLNYTSNKKDEKEEKEKKQETSSIGNFGRYVFEKSVGFDTLASDITSLSKTLDTVYNGWQTKETMQNTLSSVQSMYDRLTKYQNYQKKYGGTDLSELHSSVGSIIEGWDDLTNRYVNYSSQKEYDTVGFLQGMSTKDIEPYLNRGNPFDNKRSTYYENAFSGNSKGNENPMDVFSPIKRNDSANAKKEGDTKFDFESLRGFSFSKNNSNNKLPDGVKVGSDVAYTTASGRNITWQELYDDAYYTEYIKPIVNAPDFNEKSAYQKKDVTYKNIPGTTWYETSDESAHKYNFINRDSEAEGVELNRHVTQGNRSKSYVRREMSDEEIKIYNYLFNTQGEEKADEYLGLINDDLKQRDLAKKAQYFSEDATKNPIGASAFSVIANLSSGVEFIGDAADYLLTGEMDYNTGAYVSSTIRSTVSNNYDWDIGGWDAFDFLYNTGMSGIDSFVASTTLGNVGGIALGLSAAAQGTNDALDRGLGNTGAFLNGVAAGVFECLFESVSIGNFKKLKNMPVDSFKTLTKEIGKSMAVNAKEETFTEVANILYDNIVNGDLSASETKIRAYMSAGMSQVEAIRKVAVEQAAQVAEAGASGALMGLGFGAFGGGISYYNSYSTGKAIQANYRASDLFDITSNPEIGSAYETYTQYANQGTNAENAKKAHLGRLYNEARADAQETLNSKKSTDEQKAKAFNTMVQLSALETENTVRKEAKKEFNVGEETKVTKTNESIDVKEFKVDVKGEDVAIVTNNGEVSVDDMTLTQNDAELLYVAKGIAKENGEDLANLFISQYDGKTSVEAYQTSFNLVTEYAKNDYSLDYMLNNKGTLSATDVSNIYRETTIKAYKDQEAKIEKLIQETADQKFYKGSIDDSAITNAVWKKLDSRQRKAITFIKGLAKATGMKLVLTHNPDAKEGGSFDKTTNTITIDVAKFKDDYSVLKETIIPTMAHEMTHWMEAKSPELYHKLSGLIFSTLQEHDGIDEGTRIDLEYTNQKSKGREYSDKELRSEIVARACEDILSMSEQGQKLFASLSEAEQKTLGAKVKEFFHNIMDMIKEMLGTYKSDTYEAKALQKYQDKLQEIAKIWDEMLEKSVAANQALEKSGVFGELTNGVSADGTTIIGENALQMSDRTYRDGGRDFLVNWLNEKSGLSDEDKRSIVEQTDKIAELMRAIENEEELPDYSKWANMEVVKDENGEKVVSVIVKNGDYSMNIDFSQVCKKRVALDSVLNAMVKSGDLNLYKLMETDVAELNAIIKSHGLEIACALCFVDAKRYRVGLWAESFCEGSDDKNVHKYGFNEMVRSLIPKNSKIKVDEFNFTGRDIKNQPTKNLLSEAKDSELDFSLIDEIMANNDSKSAQHRYAKAIKENSELRKILNSSEIISSIGLDAIRLGAPKLYGLINGHQGTAKPKFAHDVTAYGNDILKAKNFTPESAKMVGGVRVQSFSDFMANMVVDYAQMISELSAKQLTSHSYTKEALFVKLFGLTGMKINMSLVPKAVDLTEEQQKYFAILKDNNANKRSKEYKQKLEEYNALAENAGLDENGNYIWEDESFPYDIAMDIQVDPRYSANCGTIAVGISNKHILKLLDDDRISMVIPYHKSSLNHEVAMMRDIALYKDYTDVQNTRSMATGKKLDSKKGEVDFDFYGDLYGTDGKEGTHDPKQTAKNYLKWCDENHYIPKFDEFRGHKNYYKLLVDFRVYDTDGTYREQQAVQPIYPSEAEFKDLILNGVVGKDGTVYGGLKQQQETSDKLSNESQQIVDEFKQNLKEKYGKNVLLHSDRDNTIGWKYSSRIDKKGKTPYNEYQTNAMIWARASDRKPGDLNILNANGRYFALIKATEDGFIELKRGNYKEVQAEYERAYRKANNKIYGNLEGIESDQRADIWDMQYVGDGGNAYRNGKQTESEGLQDNTSRNDEHLRNSNSGEYGKTEIKYSDRDYVAYDYTAILKESTIDRYLASFAAESSPKYAQAYITYMSPRDFLNLTTSSISSKIKIQAESTKLEKERFDKATQHQPIHLTIDHETGEVVGHEGRHRMVALSEEGIYDVPVLLFDSSNKLSKVTLNDFNLIGQFNELHSAVVSEAIPLNYENRDLVIEKFGTKSKAQKMHENLGLRETFLFSDRDNVSVYDIMGERDRIIKENEAFKAEVENLKERVELERKLTKGTVLNNNHLLAAAGHLRNIANSNIDKVELAKRLKDVYSYILTSNELTWEEVFSRSYNVADAMVKEAKPVVEVNDYYKQILDDIRKTRISLSESQKKEAQAIFDKNWNRRFFGKVTITDSGTAIESQWQEWAGLYPDLFRTDISDGDMIGELYDIINSLQEASETVMEYDEEETKRYLAHEIYNQYWNVSTIKTTADKYDAKIKELNSKHRQAMSKVREDYKTRMDEQHKADMAHSKEMQTKIREHRDNKLKEQHKADRQKALELYKKIRERKDNEIAMAKEKGKERLSKYKENAERKAVIQSMMGKISSLNKKFVTNSKDVHIPEDLKPVVRNLLNVIDASSKQLLGMKGTKKDARGTPTKADIAFDKSLSKVHSMAEEDVSVFTLKRAVDDALELFVNAEKLMNQASDEKTNSSVIGLDVDMIKSIKDMSNNLNILAEKGVRKFVLQKMDLNHLKTLNGMLYSINHWATVADKSLKNKHRERITVRSMQNINEMDKLGERQEYHEAIEEMKNFFNWRQTLPVNVFKRLGPAAMEFYKDLLDSQGQCAFNRQEIADFTEKLFDKYGLKNIKKWRTDVKTFDIILPGDNEATEVSMPVSYIMSLYCVAKQEDAQRHLYGKDVNGDVLTYEDDKGNVKKGGGMTIKGYKDGKLKLKVSKNLKNTIINEGIVKQITKVLTKEQIEVADKLQDFMGTKGAEWGNSVSMVLYGIKKFVVKDYFPIKASPHTLNVDKIRDNNASLFSILNFGCTKERIPEAKNSIEIADIFEVFGNHMNMMAIYNAYALSIYDISRWLNFKGKTEKGVDIAVTQSIENAFGKGALTYVNNLIKDLNGQHVSSRIGPVGTVIRNTKVAMVGNSASVALLQPTAYLKAMVKVSPTNLAKAAALPHLIKRGAKRAQEHSGLALLKAQGYFETGVSTSVITKMMHDESFMDKRREASLKGAELGDKLTWGVLWNACEFEVRAKQKDLNPGSPEYFKAVSELLEEVICETQVVDSPLTKSDLMRSPDNKAKELTNFASELTVAYNMVFECVYQTVLDAKRMGTVGEDGNIKSNIKGALKKNAKNITLSLTAYTLTSAASAVLNTLLDEFRYDDDEDEETFLEKFRRNFIMDLLIVGKIPFFRDAVSLFQGYDTARTETLPFVSAAKAVDYYKKAKEQEDKKKKAKTPEGMANADKWKEIYEDRAIDEALKSVSYTIGYGVYNQWRDLRAMLRLIGIID